MNPSTSGYSVLVAPVCCLVGVAFVVVQHPQGLTTSPALTTSQRADAKLSHLNHIAAIHLQPGMTLAEVSDCLALHGFRQVSSGQIGLSATIYYRREKLSDPVLAVDFRRKGRSEYFATEWRVEK